MALRNGLQALSRTLKDNMQLVSNPHALRMTVRIHSVSPVSMPPIPYGPHYRTVFNYGRSNNQIICANP